MPEKKTPNPIGPYKPVIEDVIGVVAMVLTLLFGVEAIGFEGDITNVLNSLIIAVAAVLTLWEDVKIAYYGLPFTPEDPNSEPEDPAA